MLKPSMQDLMKKVNNRYLLVNLAAQRARDLSSKEEELPDKPVKIALDEINNGDIEYRKGPKPEPVMDILEAMAETGPDGDAPEELLMDADDAADEELLTDGPDDMLMEEGLESDELLR